MAAPSRTQDSGLTESAIADALREDACSFEFFQAVSLLQRLAPERQPVGRFFDPKDESVNFASNSELSFPASQVESIDWSEGEAPRMTVNFMGITGPVGILPYCYSEMLLERLRAKDHALEAFLNIFNHRAISLFYRAWERSRFPVTYGLGDADTFSRHLLDLLGLGTSGLQNRQRLPDQVLMHYVGLLSSQSRSAASLRQIIENYFEVPVEVEQFVGAWYPLDTGTQCVLDEDDSTSQQLGGGAVVGDQIWDQQSRVRLKIGPLRLGEYREFLPEGSAFEPLRALTRFFSNDEFDFEVQLILQRGETPLFEIGSEDGVLQLGWVSWLNSSTMRRDPDETILLL